MSLPSHLHLPVIINRLYALLVRFHEVLGDPDEAGRREDADSADGGDTKAEHECEGFHHVLFALLTPAASGRRARKREPPGCCTA